MELLIGPRLKEGDTYYGHITCFLLTYAWQGLVLQAQMTGVEK